jgi:antitoxin MazE
MRVNIISIGNSKGIRIPKALLKQCGFGDAVDVTVKDDTLVLKRARRPREGWAESAKLMAANGDDILIETPPTEFDHEEWEW